MTASVVGAVAPKLEAAEIERTHRKPTEMLDAYDYYLRGLAMVSRYSKTTNKKAFEFFVNAIELDPVYASAYAMATRCHQPEGAKWLADKPEREISEGLRLARRAVELRKRRSAGAGRGRICDRFLGHDLDSGATIYCAFVIAQRQRCVDVAFIAVRPTYCWGSMNWESSTCCGRSA